MAKEKQFEPMLSATMKSVDEIKLPSLVSPKLDGIRCVIRDGVPLSRELKPIPNKYINTCLAGLPAFDGELIVGTPTGGDVFKRSQSGVMSRDGHPDFTYHVFDLWTAERWTFEYRLSLAEDAAARLGGRLKLLQHRRAASIEQLHDLEHRYVTLGYEGMMLRDPHGVYKHGRSTNREGGLVKWKRRQDATAVVTGFVEQMHNTNEAQKDAKGRTKRSSAKAGKVGKGTLGALVCMSLELPGRPSFEIGTGFTDAQRQEIWDSQSKYLGKAVVHYYQDLTPDEGKPRFPAFKAWRDA